MNLIRGLTRLAIVLSIGLIIPGYFAGSELANRQNILARYQVLVDKDGSIFAEKNNDVINGIILDEKNNVAQTRIKDDDFANKLSDMSAWSRISKLVSDAEENGYRWIIVEAEQYRKAPSWSSFNLAGGNTGPGKKIASPPYIIILAGITGALLAGAVSFTLMKILIWVVAGFMKD